MRVLVLGAGSSIATFNFPGVQGFGRALKQQWDSWRDDCKALDAVVSQTLGTTSDNWSLDEVWTRLDYIAKLWPALGSSPYASAASIELHPAIIVVLGRTAPWANWATVRTRGSLPSLLSEFEAGDTLISFNWDTAAENILALQLAARGLALIQAASPNPRSGVTLAKPHGSLSWSQTMPGRIAEVDGSPLLAAVHRDDVLCRRQHPVILGAVPIKSELIAEVQSGTNAWIYRCIMSQWEHLCRTISVADELCVAGYGFPDEDTHGRFLFQEAARKRGSPWSRVRLYAVDGEEGECTQARMAKALRVTLGDITAEGPLQAP